MILAVEYITDLMHRSDKQVQHLILKSYMYIDISSKEVKLHYVTTIYIEPYY